MAPRAALYLMPSLAVLATAALVLGPGRERPATGARVWGIPAQGASSVAWRVEILERQLGSDRTVALDALDLSVEQGGRRLAAWSGAAGDDGVAEAVLEAKEPLGGAVDLRLVRGEVVLAQGTIALRPVAAPTFEQRAVPGNAQGAIALRVEIERGVLASPFAGALVVRASRDGKPAAGVSLRASAEGAQLLGAGIVPPTGEDGSSKIHLQPTWHSIELRIDAAGAADADPAAKGSWEGSLPVKPGAIWLSPDPQRPAIVSPAPRDAAYVSGIGEHGRVLGAVVPLAKGASGLFEGELPGARLAQLGVRAVTVAGDLAEVGSGTVTWPFGRPEGVASAPRVELLLDGVPAAERAEKERAGTARLASVGVALAAALFEAALLVLYSRASQAALSAHLSELGRDDEERAAAARMTGSRAGRAFTLAVAVGLVLLAFGAVAAFTIVR